MGEFSNLYRCERCGLEQDPEAAPHTADDCITNLRAKLAEAQAEVVACLDFMATEMDWEHFRSDMKIGGEAKATASGKNAAKLAEFLSATGHGIRYRAETQAALEAERKTRTALEGHLVAHHGDLVKAVTELGFEFTEDANLDTTSVLLEMLVRGLQDERTAREQAERERDRANRRVIEVEQTLNTERHLDESGLRAYIADLENHAQQVIDWYLSQGLVEPEHRGSAQLVKDENLVTRAVSLAVQQVQTVASRAEAAEARVAELERELMDYVVPMQCGHITAFAIPDGDDGQPDCMGCIAKRAKCDLATANQRIPDQQAEIVRLRAELTTLRAKLTEAQAALEAERTAREQAERERDESKSHAELYAKNIRETMDTRDTVTERHRAEKYAEGERADAAEARVAELERQLGEAKAEIVEFSESTRKAGEDADEANSESDRVHRLHNVSSCPACGGPREDRPCDLCDSVGYVRVDDSAVVDQLDTANQRITDQQAEIVRLRKRAAEIADDYHPGHDSECKQALTEMRDAVDALADDPITPTPDPRDEQIRVLREALQPISDALGCAEWSKPEHAEEILDCLIRNQYERSRNALAATPTPDPRDEQPMSDTQVCALFGDLCPVDGLREQIRVLRSLLKLIDSHADMTHAKLFSMSWDTLRCALDQVRQYTKQALAATTRCTDSNVKRIAELEAEIVRLRDVIKYKVYGWRESDWPEGFCRMTAELIADSVRDSLATTQPTPASVEDGYPADTERQDYSTLGNEQPASDKDSANE